jgi:PQQ enzyme repeat
VRSLNKLPPESVSGDPANGARVYARATCGSCHIVAGVFSALDARNGKALWDFRVAWAFVNFVVQDCRAAVDVAEADAAQVAG